MISNCPRCQKSPDLCVCASLSPAETRLHVLFLQHPQEPKEALSTARIAHLALPNSTLKIGLSWPNLRAALGRETSPSQWAVLYLGSGIKGAPISQNPIQFVTKNGTPTPAPSSLEGIVILDGTWSQAKALWWRNAWLLKLKRVILQPSRPSLYRELRKEPRKECLSTLESTAETLVALGELPATGEMLRNLFSELLDKQRLKLKSRTADKAKLITPPIKDQ